MNINSNFGIILSCPRDQLLTPVKPRRARTNSRPFIMPNSDLHILTRCVQINSLPGNDHNGQRRRQPCHFHVKSFDIGVEGEGEEY